MNHITPASRKRKRRFQSGQNDSSDELARLGAALTSETTRVARQQRAAGTAGQRGPTGTKAASIAALQLLLLTGCRVGEALSLRWQHVDIERRLLLLPDSKTGARFVFLSKVAIDLIRSLERDQASEYLFAGDRPGKPVVSLQKTWERVCKAAKIDGIRLHDLRHSYTSVGAVGGLSLPVIGALLGHSQPSTTARYAHLAASPLHEAADTISNKSFSRSGERADLMRVRVGVLQRRTGSEGKRQRTKGAKGGVAINCWSLEMRNFKTRLVADTIVHTITGL